MLIVTIDTTTITIIYKEIIGIITIKDTIIITIIKSLMKIIKFMIS